MVGTGREPQAVSACLAGIPCRYDGQSRPSSAIVRLAEEGIAIPVCAEVLAGLPTPRPSAEIIGGDGEDVLSGRAKVVCEDGTDVTEQFVRGARLAADTLVSRGLSRATLQARSPSCGCEQIYDGTHTGTLRSGDGVFAAELKRRGIAVESVRGEQPECD